MLENINSDEFYRRRDNRTDQYADGTDYRNFHVGLGASPSTVNTFNGQVQLALATNMLSRWCRNIEFIFPDALLDASLQRPDAVTLHERILQETQNADPFGMFVFNLSPSRSIQYLIWVGEHDQSEKVDFCIDGSGWLANAGTEFLPPPQMASSGNNIIGPAFAACIGVGDAFKVATNQSSQSRVKSISFSLFDFSLKTNLSSLKDYIIPTPITIGNTMVVGLGSVGSAVIYLLGMVPFNGRLSFIDHDLVEIENLNRSPIFGINEIGLPKVTAVAGFLNKLECTPETFAGRFDEYIKHGSFQLNQFDLLLPLANEYNVRSYIENNYPPIQIYGTTTPSWGINYHRHIPLNEDCSICRFPNEESEVQFPCSTTQIIGASERKMDASLPFLSVGAAVLVMADLVKMQFPGYPFTPNFVEINFKGNMDFVFPFQRASKLNCPFTTRSSNIHKIRIMSTLFSGFSGLIK